MVLESNLLVIGNESADLDSLVCSFVLASILMWSGRSAVPVINVTESGRVERLKSSSHEIRKIFEKCIGNPFEKSVRPRFRFVSDYLKDNSEESEGSVGVILVDHNTRSDSWSKFAARLVGFIDHHALSSQGQSDPHPLKVTAGPSLGSCSTLVAEILLECTKKKSTSGSNLLKSWIAEIGPITPQCDGTRANTLAPDDGTDFLKNTLQFEEGKQSSSAAIMAEKSAKAEEQRLRFEGLAKLLCYAILRDTHNFAEKLKGKRWQKEDLDTYDQLIEMLPVDGTTFRKEAWRLLKKCKDAEKAELLQAPWDAILQHDAKIYKDMISDESVFFASVHFPLEQRGRLQEMFTELKRLMHLCSPRAHNAFVISRGPESHKTLLLLREEGNNLLYEICAQHWPMAANPQLLTAFNGDGFNHPGLLMTTFQIGGDESRKLVESHLRGSLRR